MEADPAVQIFGSEEYDLYGALGLEEGASADTIKKAYRKLALLYHPDKLSSKADAERETAREKFQQVGYAYAVLSNDDRKARYDATGRTDETLLGGDGNWDEYFKELWQGEVNASTIDDFFATYQGSEEERNDVKAAYTESAGDIEHILANCMSADALSAEEHFTTLINAAIEAGDLKATKAWKRTLKDAKGRERRAAAAQDEAREAEAMAKELGVHDKLFGSKKKGKGAAKADEGAADEDALRALIQQKGKQRMESTISALEAKYAALEQEAAKARSKRKGAAVEEEEPPARKGKKAKKDSGPTEEEFAAIQAKMMAGKGAKGSSSKSKGKK